MSGEKKWHECPCGESICVSESDWGAFMLAEWRKMHHGHAALGLTAEQEGEQDGN